MPSKLQGLRPGASSRCFDWLNQCHRRWVWIHFDRPMRNRKNNDTELAYAWFLYHQGDRSGAARIINRLSHIRFETQGEHSWGFSDITYTIRLRWLQELLGVPEGVVPGATDEREEANVRVEQTARQLGYLLAHAAKGQVPGDRHALFRSLLLFHNRPVHFSEPSPRHGDDFILQTSRNAIYKQVSKLAKAMGSSGLSALRDIVMDLTSGQARRNSRRITEGTLRDCSTRRTLCPGPGCQAWSFLNC